MEAELKTMGERGGRAPLPPSTQRVLLFSCSPVGVAGAAEEGGRVRCRRRQRRAPVQDGGGCDRSVLSPLSLPEFYGRVVSEGHWGGRSGAGGRGGGTGSGGVSNPTVRLVLRQQQDQSCPRIGETEMAFSFPQQQPLLQQSTPNPFQTQTPQQPQFQFNPQQPQPQPSQQPQFQFQMQQPQSQFQMQLPQQPTFLFKSDKSPATYNTKWEELHPDSQKYLLEIE